MGVLPASHPGQERGRQDLLRFLQMVNQELRLRTWLVGERISLADITLACSLLLVMTHCEVDRVKLPHFTRWYNTVTNQRTVKEILDGVDLGIKGAPVEVKDSPSMASGDQGAEEVTKEMADVSLGDNDAIYTSE